MVSKMASLINVAALAIAAATLLLCSSFVPATNAIRTEPRPNRHPQLPLQYTVKRDVKECGEGGKTNCGEYKEMFYFDFKKLRQLEVIDYGKPKDPLVPIVHKLLAHDKKLVYTWTEKHAEDCEVKKEDDTNGKSFVWEWEWMNHSDTKKKGVVECPKVPKSEQISHLGHHEKCIEYAGQWPSEITSDVELWFKERSDLPYVMHMQCAILPFELFYTYSNFTVGPPPSHMLEPPKACLKALSEVNEV